MQYRALPSIQREPVATGRQIRVVSGNQMRDMPSHEGRAQGNVEAFTPKAQSATIPEKLRDLRAFVVKLADRNPKTNGRLITRGGRRKITCHVPYALVQGAGPHPWGADPDGDRSGVPGVQHATRVSL